ncbi:endonuclease 8-like 1 isoform X1 [Otolemur garnettii]|uniref:Endonuclease 8-like 1 n=1 Tax=Otolemur garnettii TaxID=30611 RepID=H0WFV0_OTOGA|nr:endonuclease 8-like 1 isoform X1 [Otolemur garnettii]XP_023365718.1 endonuclease 8-like 1 isoform X1 [Otolemur garnettii]
MPEGPEVHLASHFVNEACGGLVFGGCVEKSPISRNPEVPFESTAYCISASARGKELRLTLSPLPGAQPPQEPLALVFRFGMSGSFQLVPGDALPPHAHLRFYTAPPGPRLALCFVDIRRFGRWDLGGEWQLDRGPCVLLEYEQFRENVLRNLADKAFDRPICEALLDQRFFNGIGNYLRAEILFRLRIPPFEKARTVLEALQQRRLSPELTLSQKIRAKLQNPDLLELCHSVPKEVVQLGGKGYGPESGEEDFAAFRAWLQCYGVPGMSSLRDRHGRTIWFQGDPGPLAPKGCKSRQKKSKATQLSPEDRVEDPPPPRRTSARIQKTQRDLPEKTTTQQPEGSSLQQDPGAFTVPNKGRKKRRQATTGHRRLQKIKGDTPSSEPEGTSAS